MSLKQFSFSKLFTNTRFRVFFAIFTAFFFWLSITIEQTDIVTDTYTVSIESLNTPSWLGGQQFQVVARSRNSVEVTVHGPVSVVSALEDDDIKIDSDFNGVDTQSGVYEVLLKVSNANDYPGVTFTISPKRVQVEIDMITEKTFSVEAVAPDITLDDNASSGMRICPPVFGNTNSETIKISGPNNKIELIDSVKAVVDTKEAISKTKQYTAKLKLYDKDGKEITDVSPYTFENDGVGVVVQVQPKKTVAVVVMLKDYEGNVYQSSIPAEISPNYITVYGPPEVINNLGKINLEPINASEITATNNTFVVGPQLPSNVFIDETVHDEDLIITVKFFLQ